MKLRARFRHYSRSAFTLMEIMLVVLIIALLAGLAIWQLGDVLGDAHRAAALSNMNAIKTALLMYRGNTGSYPTTGEGLPALVTRPEGAERWRQCMTELRKDPYGMDYGYSFPGRKNPNGYDLWSFGPDKQNGTADDVWPN